MNRVLLVDSVCSRCQGLATDIRQASDGLLEVRSLRDAHMRDLLDRARLDLRREPTLIETERDAVRVFTGLTLRTRLIAVLGLRRALHIAELVARSQTDLFADSGYKVKFEHEKKKYSGKIDVNYGGGGKTFTSVLKRDNDRFQLAFSGERVSGTDAKGDAFVARWDRQRERWDVDRDSERVIQGNERDFLISAAIAADLQDRASSARLATSSQVAIEQVRCFDNWEPASSGPWPSLSKNEACDIAETIMLDLCEQHNKAALVGNCKGKGCCDMEIVRDPCLTIPNVARSDFFCTCEYRGRGHVAC